MSDVDRGIWFLAIGCGDLDSRLADDERLNMLSVGRGRMRWLQQQQALPMYATALQR